MGRTSTVASKNMLLSTGVGNRSEARVRKLVRGNMVTEEIYQLNTMLIEGTLRKNKRLSKAPEQKQSRQIKSSSSVPISPEFYDTNCCIGKRPCQIGISRNMDISHA